MKKLYFLSLLTAGFYVANAQNVGIGTTNPETKLQVEGALSLKPSSGTASAGNIAIPADVSVFRIADDAVNTAITVTATSPKEGQTLTIYNSDANTATFYGNAIVPNSGVISCLYVNGAWRLVSDNSASGNNFIKNQTGAQSGANFNISGNGTIGGNLNTTGTATIAGATNLNGGVTVNGAANINTSGSSVTNIGTGSNSGAVTLGNSANNVNLPKLNASSIVRTDASKNLTTGAVNLNSADVTGTLPVGNLPSLNGDVTGAINSNTIANNAVNSAKIADGSIMNADINAAAAIERTKIANGAANHVVINNASGTLSSEAQLAVSRGGTGLSALGSANQVLGVNNAGTAAEYKTVSGTTNRVSVTHAANSVTLTTPQDIHTAASPTFAGATFSGLSTSSAVYTDASKNLTSTIPNNGTLGYWTRNNANGRLYNTTLTDNVGIGIAAAAHKLHVEGGSGFFSTSTNAHPFTIGRSYKTSNHEEIRIGIDDANTYVHYINDEGASKLHFRLQNTDTESPSTPSLANDNTILTLHSTATNGGMVGIGQQTPSQKLDVNGVITAVSGYRVNNAVAAIGSYLRGNGTNFVASTIQATDIPDLGSTYIRNQTSLQSGADFNISGAGTFGSSSPLTFTSIGTGTYNRAVIYHNATDGLMIERARTTDVNNGTITDFQINQRGGGTPALMVKGNGNVGIGTTDYTAKFNIATPNLGTALNDVVEMQRLYGGNGNASYLDIRHIRTAAGSSWLSAGTRIQEKIDATWMGYMQFNGNDNNGGISFGTGTTTTAPGNVAERMRIASNGNVGIGSTDPADKLEVRGGNLRLTQTSNNSNGAIIYRNEAQNTTNQDWRLVYRDDFQADANGWITVSGIMNWAAVQPNNNMLTNCCASTGSHRNSVYKKEYNLTNIPHTYIKIKATYCFIDSWDGEEDRGWITAHSVDGNGYLIWAEDHRYNDLPTTFYGSASWSDTCKDIEGTLYHTANALWIRVGSVLDDNPNDESFAIDNVEIWVR